MVYHTVLSGCNAHRSKHGVLCTLKLVGTGRIWESVLIPASVAILMFFCVLLWLRKGVLRDPGG